MNNKQKNMKTLLILISSLLLFSPLLTGCSRLKPNHVDFHEIEEEKPKKEEKKEPEKEDPNKTVTLEEIHHMEMLNIINDTNTFIEIYNNQMKEISKLHEEDLKKEEKQSKNNLAIYNYMTNINVLASSRLSSDIEEIFIHTEEYMGYIALLQTYVDSFDTEKEAIELALLNGDADTKKLTSFKTLVMIEDFYFQAYEKIATDNSSLNSGMLSAAQSIIDKYNNEENQSKSEDEDPFEFLRPNKDTTSNKKNKEQKK